ncbi:MAG: hypothetical protein WBC35_06620 [Saprospiraceae bacterium]|jgi:glycerol uptake facilitator-like aquaporin|nr:hypothetical protein [Saprospiraceae bacterium]
MNSKVIIAALIGGIVAFLLGWLLYGVLLMDFMASNAGSATGVMKTDPQASDFIFVFLGNVGYALLLAYIFDQWANIKTLATGAKAGALIGLLIGISYDFLNYGMTNLMNMTGAVADILMSAVMGAVTGAVVAWWLGRGAATS